MESVTKLLPVASASVQAPTSSSSPQIDGPQIETELDQLIRMLARIKAVIYGAESRTMDKSVKLGLKELRSVAYDAEDVLDEYKYEVLRTQVARPDSHNRELIQMPDGMLDQIKVIKERFHEIERDRIALQLMEGDKPPYPYINFRKPPTVQFVFESTIFGREIEKEALVDMLSSGCKDGEVVSAVTIVGTGGLGKTTLAQLVYNDQRIKESFDMFGWIFVSDDFNVERLMRETIMSISRSKCDLADLNALQDELSNKVRGKRILVVLDDVWNENITLWKLFRTPFKSATLAKFLLTTRNESVAQTMQALPSFKLGYLSEENSWKLFQQYAFDVNRVEVSKFQMIGKEIMKKCGMLPLAIKSIASLLRLAEEEESWVEVLDSELWQSGAGDVIFAALQISYRHLPSYLKPCFVYCSMFPKGYQCNAEQVVQLWISQGYIQSNKKNNVEEIGWNYAKQLWQRSLFETEYGGKQFHMAKFKLHDMIHDLAKLNSESECYSIESDRFESSSNEVRHLFVGNFVKF